MRQAKCVWHNSSICFRWLTYMYMRHDGFVCMMWRTCMRWLVHTYVTLVWLTHVEDLTDVGSEDTRAYFTFGWHATFISETRLDFTGVSLHILVSNRLRFCFLDIYVHLVFPLMSFIIFLRFHISGYSHSCYEIIRSFVSLHFMYVACYVSTDYRVMFSFTYVSIDYSHY